MDAEINVTGRVFVTDCADFCERVNSLPKASNPGTSLAAYSLVLAGVVVTIRVAGFCMDDSGKPTRALPMLCFDEADKLTNDDVGGMCKELSEFFGCTVSVCCDREFFGVENVYNGGSDFAVVNEECLVCAYDCGSLVLLEKTDHWNDVVNSMERDFLAGQESARLLARFNGHH